MANERPYTFAEARALLYSHATDDPGDADGTFRNSLNEAIERIFDAGIWDGLTVRLDVSSWITAEVMTLPYAYEALIAVAVDDVPYPIIDEGLEFMQTGPGVEDAGQGGNVVIDLGFVEVSNELVRRYKFLMDIGATTEVEGIVKKRFVHITNDTDYIYPSHIGALKHALLAICFENEGDIARSQAYWEECYVLLAQQKSTNNTGVVRPHPAQNYGFMIDKPRNMV